MSESQPEVIVVTPVRQPRGALYWIFIGWWWGPLKWAGRMVLWLFMWPLGLWRSWAQHRKNQERRTGKALKKTLGD